MLASWSKTSDAKLGPIALAQGVSVWNALSMQLGAFLIAVLVPFLNFVQPYLLTEHLGIPQSEQGQIVGDLGFYTEIVILLMSGLVGALSDRVGRRIIYAVGIAVMALSLVLYPLASGYWELVLYRLVFAAGAAMAGAMMVAVLTDYPAEKSRGMLAATVGMISIIGVLIMIATMSNLPQQFREAGYGAIESGRYSFWIVAVIGFVGAVVLAIGLKPPSGKTQKESAGALETLRIGLNAARGNRRLGFAFASAFCGRADLVVVTTFFSLWAAVAGAEAGLTVAESLQKAGFVFGIVMLSSLFSAPVFGWIIDRIGRLKAQCLALLIAAIGYTAMGFVTDPMGSVAIIPAIILGVGQMAAITAAQALVGEESPAEIRGAISGFFTFCGALGILFATKVGGELFDLWMPGAPFVLMGAANFVVFLGGVWIYYADRNLGSVEPAE